MMFTNVVVKYCRSYCRTLINESIVFGLDCWTSCPSFVFLSEMASLFSMLQYYLQSSWFEGGLQKFNTMMTLLRLGGSSSRLLFG